MSWRVILTDACGPDLDRLDEGDRATLAEELFAWVEAGPPRTTSRQLAGATLFEDRLPSGLDVAYFVHEPESYVAIVRARRMP